MPKKHHIHKNTKSISLSINTIVIAAMALIILVVLIAVFTDQSERTVTTLEDCASRGGSCEIEENCGYVKIPNICPEGKVCCVPIKSD